jgi:hypothetical protein
MELLKRQNGPQKPLRVTPEETLILFRSGLSEAFRYEESGTHFGKICIEF